MTDFRTPRRTASSGFKTRTASSGFKTLADTQVRPHPEPPNRCRGPWVLRVLSVTTDKPWSVRRSVHSLCRWGPSGTLVGLGPARGPGLKKRRRLVGTSRHVHRPSCPDLLRRVPPSRCVVLWSRRDVRGHAWTGPWYVTRVESGGRWAGRARDVPPPVPTDQSWRRLRHGGGGTPVGGRRRTGDPRACEVTERRLQGRNSALGVEERGGEGVP